MTTLQDRFTATAASMNGRLLEREELIDVTLVGLLSGTNLAVIGPPGTAKSMTFRLLSEHVQDAQPGDWWTKLFTPYLVPSQIWGAIDIEALKNSVHRHVVDHRSLASAKIAFMDEAFKGSTAILNSLLMALNERKFSNDVEIDIPLRMAIAASNELPADSGGGVSLAALYDRFGLRMVIDPIRSTSNVARMLTNEFESTPVVPTFSWEDVDTARQEVERIDINDDVIECLITFRKEMNKQGLTVSDRRLRNAIPVIKATAWLRGVDEADIEDVRHLTAMLWDDPSDRTVVNKIVLAAAAPLDAEAMTLQSEVDSLSEELEAIIADSDSEVSKRQATITFNGKLKSAISEVESLKARSNRPSQKIDDLDRLVKELDRRMLVDLLKVPVSSD